MVVYTVRKESSKNRISKCFDEYRKSIEDGLLVFDLEQEKIIQKLESLLITVENQEKKKLKVLKNWFFFKTRKKNSRENINGIYLYGGVGTGKSMLINIFFEQLVVSKKRRVHFHEFMEEIHQGINKARQQGESDPILSVARTVAKDNIVLCLDEVQISDIADAMIVGRLFSQLFGMGVVLVTTSNRHPGDLYKNGLNRQIFIPFINLIMENLNVIRLNVAKDYRRDRLINQPLYFTPNISKNKLAFDRLWRSMVLDQPKPLKLNLKGRIIVLPYFQNGVGKCNFKDLCEKPLGASDYLSLCQHLKVLFLDRIPILNGSKADAAKRFVILIDTLYEAKIKLICLAETTPENLYTTGLGAFEFERTVSRLYEMQSSEWI